jgi:hypothetical protein
MLARVIVWKPWQLGPESGGLNPAVKKEGIQYDLKYHK